MSFGADHHDHGGTTVSAPRLPQLPDALCPCTNVRRSCEEILTGQDVLLPSNHFEAPLDVDEEGGAESFSEKDTSRCKPDFHATEGEGQRCVSINEGNLNKLADKILHLHTNEMKVIEWDEHEWHYGVDPRIRKNFENLLSQSEQAERVALYVLCLDALNFCFWPYPNLEYEHLAIALTKVAQEDEGNLLKVELRGDSDNECSSWNATHFALHPNQLCQMTPSKMNQLLGPYLPAPPQGLEDCLPNLAERCRLLREVGFGLLHHTTYRGSILALLEETQQSASKLVYLILQIFPGFRDTTIHPSSGRQVCFYKRAQIFVGDLWAALGSQNSQIKLKACQFQDIHKLTMFADYRVPQVLRDEGALIYSKSLAQKIDSSTILAPNSPEELYIRATTIVAVDRLVELIRKKSKDADNEIKTADVGDIYWCAIRVDWHLWQVGEARIPHMKKHHCVRTIFY
jgi:hypothetical protein